MMNKLKAKLKKQGGFTLIEMLIVVAIIAILVAVSIPLVSNALDKAKRATDAANVRAAMAEAAIEYLATDGNEVAATIYDADAGKLDSATTTGYGQTQTTNGQVVWVKVDADGQVSWAWGATGSTEPTSWNTKKPNTTADGNA